MTGDITAKSNITCTKEITASAVYNAVWNDYAELFERGEETEAGDIIALDLSSGEEKYIKATADSEIVVGVHSDTFGHLIGGEAPQNGEDFVSHNLPKYIPVALCGRVAVKVTGEVKVGDWIVPSEIPGIGKASKDSNRSVGVVVSILDNSTVKVLIKK